MVVGAGGVGGGLGVYGGLREMMWSAKLGGLHPPAHPSASAHRQGFQAACNNFDCRSVHFGLILTTFAGGVVWGTGAGGEPVDIGMALDWVW